MAARVLLPSVTTGMPVTDGGGSAGNSPVVSRRRSVPKKDVAATPVSPVVAVSLLPYTKHRMRKQWSHSEMGSCCSLSGAQVLKFGGSSVGSRLGQVLSQIEAHRASGDQPLCVVVSAMGKTTDCLIDAADAACEGRPQAAEERVRAVERICMDNVAACAPGGECPEAAEAVRQLVGQLRDLLLGIGLVAELSPATLDRLLSFGERLSASVVAALLRGKGTPAVAVDGANWVVTDEVHGNAKVQWDETQAKLTELVATFPPGAVPVVTGFIGATAAGRRTTLGRNGSDYTAALLALGVGASKVIINTDVPGVFTADPRIVRDAFPVPELSYMEAVELAIYGSRMFHPRTILPLVEQGIPMLIRDTNDLERPGTTICAAPAPQGSATCVTTLDYLVLVSLRSRLGQDAGGTAQHIGVRLVATLEGAGVSIYQANFAANGLAVHVVIRQDDAGTMAAAVQREFEREIRASELDDFTTWQPVTLLTLVRAPQPVLPKFFAALTAAQVRLRCVGQAANSENVSVVIDSEQREVAVRCAHTAIDLGHQVVSLLVLGNNETSRGLLRRIAERRDELRSLHRTELRVVGVLHTCSGRDHNARYIHPETGEVTLNEWGVDCLAEADLLSQPKHECTEFMVGNRPMHETVSADVLQRLRQMSVPIVVDCSRLEVDSVPFYRNCAALNIHIIVSNAAAIARLGDAAITDNAGRETILMYDSSIGAAVPISSTVRQVNRMGDPITSVEASLSGTCGFVISQLMQGVPLSEAVGIAMDKGYTEPDPSDDLSGADFARKLSVLARQMGRRLAPGDVAVSPLVPRECLAALGQAQVRSERLAVLRRCDESMRGQVEAARARGERLAFIGCLEFEGPRSSATIQPRSVPADHPAAALSDVEIYVALRSTGKEREDIQLKGPGCGSASAHGVVGDILLTALRLQGKPTHA